MCSTKLVHGEDADFVKPENMLCTSKELPMTVKVMDFGLGRHTKWRPNTPNTSDTDDDTLGPDGLMTTPVGTPHFVAPEILMSIPYGKEIDLFATGVVMYWLLSGKLPFAAEEGDMLMDQIKQTEYSFPEEEWRHVSDEAKGLIDGLLERSPYARFSASDALGHEWFLGGHVGALVLGKAGSGEFGENPFSPRGRVERRMTLDGSEDGEDENGGL